MGMHLRQTLRFSALALAASLFGGCASGDVNSLSYAAAEADCLARTADCADGAAIAYVDIPAARRADWSGTISDYRQILVGTGRDRNRDRAVDRKSPRGDSNDGRSASGKSTPVVAPAIQEIPIPSPAPQATRPVRAAG